MLFMYLELIGKGLGMFWDDLEAMKGNSIEILKFCRTRVHYPCRVQ